MFERNRPNRGDILLVFLAALCLPFVWAASVAAEIYGKPDAPLVAEVLGTKIHTDDPDEMQFEKKEFGIT